MSGSFSVAADAWITMSAGSAGAVGTGAYTIAVLVQPAIGNNNCGMVGARTASAAVRSFFEDALHLFGDSDFSSGYGTLTQGSWYVLAQSKPAGSAHYRFHVWPYASNGSGTMSHGEAVGAANHADPSAITEIRIGNAVDRGNGLIAAVGLWTSALSDPQLDTLVSVNLSTWAALSPAELLSLQNWDGVSAVTTAVGTSAFSSLTGTVAAGANPPSFNFSLASTITGTGAGTVGGLTGAAAGSVTVTATAAGTVGGLIGTAVVNTPTVLTASLSGAALTASQGASPLSASAAGPTLTATAA